MLQKEGLLRFHFLSLSERKAGAVLPCSPQSRLLRDLSQHSSSDCSLCCFWLRTRHKRSLHFWREPSLEWTHVLCGMDLDTHVTQAPQTQNHSAVISCYQCITKWKWFQLLRGLDLVKYGSASVQSNFVEILSTILMAFLRICLFWFLYANR